MGERIFLPFRRLSHSIMPIAWYFKRKRVNMVFLLYSQHLHLLCTRQAIVLTKGRHGPENYGPGWARNSPTFVNFIKFIFDWPRFPTRIIPDQLPSCHRRRWLHLRVRPPAPLGGRGEGGGDRPQDEDGHGSQGGRDHAHSQGEAGMIGEKKTDFEKCISIIWE